MKIVFATNNAHKLSEVQAVLGDAFTLLTPRDCGVEEDIPEEQQTLEGNASQKSHYLHGRTGLDCFADDTGLEVEALGGKVLFNTPLTGLSAARSTFSKASSRGGASTARPGTRGSATTRCSSPTAMRRRSPR